MDELNWQRIQDYYYGRRKNRVPEEYYKGKFTLIKLYFKNNPITYNTISGFYMFLKEKFREEHKREMSNSYRNKYLSILKVCARLTGTNIDEYKGDNEDLDRVETEKLSVGEYERLLNTTILYERDREYKNFKDRLLIKVAIITTQRPRNLSNLKWNDFIQGYLHFRGKNTPKNGRVHSVYLPLHIQDAVGKLQRFEYLFGSSRGAFDLEWFNDMIKKRCILSGITKHITARSFRGTGATEYLKKNALHKVAKITGHKDVRVLANHYYDPQNSEIEQIVDNNPFDPQPLTEEEILRLTNEFVTSLHKRNCQVVLVPQNNNYMLTIPKRV